MKAGFARHAKYKETLPSGSLMLDAITWRRLSEL